MRKTWFAVLAVLSVLGAGALACGVGIEVVSVHYVGGASDYLTRSTGAPAGSYVEAVIVTADTPIVVDVKPVDVPTGLALVHFPAAGEVVKYVVLRGPCGEFLAVGGDGYDGLTEWD